VPRFTPENRAANQAMVDLLSALAAQHNATSAQIALAWLLPQKPWNVPIPSTRKRLRLDENLAAADLMLSPEDLRQLDEASSSTAVAGARYSESSQRMINR
jgi:aryl-alcohol dehydrogenase-like predicted oxidoreductase